MTAIVGVCHSGRVYLGGDSACSGGDHVSIMAEPKVWRASGMIFGVCGDLCVLQGLKYRAQWPRYKGQDGYKFLGVHIAPMFRQVIKAIEQETKDGYSPDAEMLVGIGGKLFSFDVTGAFCDQGNAWAIGSGGDVANGVLYHTTGEDPEDRITCALEAAEEVCSSVSSPFTIIWQD